MGALMDPLSWTDAALGEMPASVEIKLVSWAEAGYLTTNDPPQGEVWIRGGGVTAGYLDMDQETSEAYTDDGWFKTGDIGYFDKKGQLVIIDRRKSLIKGVTGEYVSLEKLEAVYRSTGVVQQLCVHLDTTKPRPIAIVVSPEHTLEKLAAEHGIEDHDLTQNAKINGLVLQQLQGAASKAGLAPFEVVQGVVVTCDEWTAASGLVTAAQKVNRRAVLQKHQKDVAKAYGDA